MEKLFLSYTYRPHPQHEADLERLRKCVVRAVEAMGLRVIDGVDVGGSRCWLPRASSSESSARSGCALTVSPFGTVVRCLGN